MDSNGDVSKRLSRRIGANDPRDTNDARRPTDARRSAGRRFRTAVTTVTLEMIGVARRPA